MIGAAAPITEHSFTDLCARWGIDPKTEDTLGGSRLSQANESTCRETDSWSQPVSLGSDLPPVAPFSEDLLPDLLRPLVLDISERMQVSPDFAGVGVLSALFGSVNRRCRIQPKNKDTSWVVVPNAWGGIIAPPGLLKSPLIEAAHRPLKQIEVDWRKKHGLEAARYKAEVELFQIKLATWRTQAKAADKNGATLPPMPAEPVPPECRRNILNDGTFEAVHLAKSKNPAGIFLVRDELTGWLSLMDRPGEKESELSIWRHGTATAATQWIGSAGASSTLMHVVCRCSAASTSSVRSYISDTIRDGPANDGLIQRFQLMVWPDFPSGGNTSMDLESSGRRSHSERPCSHSFDGLGNPANLPFCC